MWAYAGDQRCPGARVRARCGCLTERHESVPFTATDYSNGAVFRLDGPVDVTTLCRHHRQHAKLDWARRHQDTFDHYLTREIDPKEICRCTL